MRRSPSLKVRCSFPHSSLMPARLILTLPLRGDRTGKAQPYSPGRVQETGCRIPPTVDGPRRRHCPSRRGESACGRDGSGETGRVHGWFHYHFDQVEGDVPGESWIPSYSSSRTGDSHEGLKPWLMRQMITMGGNAEIECIDSSNPFSEGEPHSFIAK